MELKLIQLGEYGDQEYLATGKECVIGREPSCHVRPDHGQVSNRHTRLYWQANRLMVEDLNTPLGTSVNGVDLEGSPVEVRDFDHLRAGPVHFVVLVTSTPQEMAVRTRDWVFAELKKRYGEGASQPSDSNISPAMMIARNILGRLVEQETGSAVTSQAAQEGAGHRGLSVSNEQGVTLAKVLDRSLIDDQEISGLATELEQLIASGRRRIALNFANVEHCSSQALSTVLRAQEHCKKVGGLIKICTVKPQVAELFRMTNVQRHIEVFPDTLPALESLWPHAGSAEAEEPTPAPKPSTAAASPAPTTPSKSTTPAPVELVVDVGKSRGQSIPIRTARFVIGRDRRCQLRPNSDTVSRIHAIVEMREGKVFVRDYGTKNGTVVGSRVLHGEEAELKDGDFLQVGVLKFRAKFRAGAVFPDVSNEDALAAWLLDQESSDPDAPTALIETYKHHEPDEPEEKPEPEPEAIAPRVPLGQISHQTRNGVLVVCIEPSDLDDEATVGPLRYELQTIFDQPLPRKVVLDLENVNYLSSRAVGVILAFYQHLDRVQGTLRVCCVQPKLLPVLDQMRLPRLIDLYASVEEAVGDPWV